MNSIKYRFTKTQTKERHRGDYGIFREAVAGRFYNRRSIRENFLKLVPKDDYDATDTKKLLAHLYGASNTPMNNRFRGKKKNLKASISPKCPNTHEVSKKAMNDQIEDKNDALFSSNFVASFPPQETMSDSQNHSNDL